MKAIAEISTFEEPTPPRAFPGPNGGTYGGTEEIAGLEAAELNEEYQIPVILYASGRSYVPPNGDLVACTEGPIRRALTPETTIEERTELSLSALKRAIEHIKQNEQQIGVVVNHFGPTALKHLRDEGIKLPVVTRYHGLITDKDRAINKDYPDGINVFISRSQRSSAGMPGHVVYNGVDPDQFEFRPTPTAPNLSEQELAALRLEGLPVPGYTLFYGSYSPVKGGHLAIQAAYELNETLVMAGKTDPTHIPYKERFINPHVDSSQIFAYGEVGREGQRVLHHGAGRVIAPIQWEEPFGMAMVEAGFFGVPIGVIGNGALRETIKHGVSGIVARDYEELIRMWPKLDSIKPEDCRNHVQSRFTKQHMVTGMLKIIRNYIEIPSSPTVIVDSRGPNARKPR